MSLENLSTRVNYYGTHTKARMETDKLRSLKAALKNSYQRQTAILQDGREFFCLINPDKLKNGEMFKLPILDDFIDDYDYNVVVIDFVCTRRAAIFGYRDTADMCHLYGLRA